MIKVHFFTVIATALLFTACKRTDEPDRLECHSYKSPENIHMERSGRGVVLPTAFSPNGDGKNDMLRFIATDTATIRSISMKISDANGNVLKMLNSAAESWDGYDAANKKFYPPGVYRVDFEVLVNGAPDADYRFPGHSCITLFGSSSKRCLIVQGNPSDYVFEDQIDPSNLNPVYATAENFCP